MIQTFVMTIAIATFAISAAAEEIEIPRAEAAVQISSGSIPNCCSSHSVSSTNANQLSIKSCSTMGGYCMGSRNAPILTFDLSGIPENAELTSARLRGSRSSPRSGGGTASIIFSSEGAVEPWMFDQFGGRQRSFNWTATTNFTVSLTPAWFAKADREGFVAIRLTAGHQDASFIRNSSSNAPRLEIAYEIPCLGDITDDGQVNSADLGYLIAAWGQRGHPADLDGDGAVGAEDLGIMLGTWGSCSTP